MKRKFLGDASVGVTQKALGPSTGCAVLAWSLLISAILAPSARADVYDQRMEQAHISMGQGQYAEAEQMARAALEAASKTYADAPHWKIADAQQLLGEALAFEGKSKEAIAELEEALIVAEKTTGKDSELVGLIVNDLGVVSFDLGDYARTEVYLTRAIDLMEKNKSTEGADYALALHNLAGVYDKQKKYVAAEDFYKRAIAAFRKQGVMDHRLALSLQFLGQMYSITGRADQALPLAKEALELCEKNLGADHQQTERARKFLEVLQH